MEVQELRIDEIKVDEEITIQHADDFADYSLDDLAQQINDGHQGLQVATRRLAVHVAQVGAWLTAAKAKCQHGEWLPWLADNCPEITRRTATRYMQLYERAASNGTLMSHLTPTQAYKALGVVRNNNGSDWYQSSDSDDWWTPQWVFDMLDQEFGFEIDVCASAENAKCERFFSREDNALDQEWAGVCWMNPPYGRSGDQGIYQWMQKARQSAQAGATVVCFVPARTDTLWWWDHALEGEIRFIKGRLKFSNAANSAPFPQAAVIFRPGLIDQGQVIWWKECQQP
jgi:phage N-6-adenine-methyltransferase